MPSTHRFATSCTLCWLSLGIAMGGFLAGCAGPSGPGGAPGTSSKSRADPRHSSKPKKPPSPGQDAAPAVLPSDLERTPDAVARVEPIRVGGPNKPYTVLGQSYSPLTRDEAFKETGLASWYGTKFHGVPTASGEPYDMYAMTAAHPTLPIPSYARVRNPANGREVIVRVNDRGPFVKGRIIDLSLAAATRLDVARGVAPVEVERLTFNDIRALASAAPPPQQPLPQPPSVPPVATDNSPAAPTAPWSPLPETPATPSPAPSAAPTPAPTLGIVPPTPTPQAAMLPTLSPRRGWWLQLGAFQDREGAAVFGSHLTRMAAWLEPLLGTLPEREWHKVQVGPYPTREEAGKAAQRLREELQIVPMLVERR